jgi:hypothetical protein
VSDAATQWPLDALGDLLSATIEIWSRSRSGIHA